MAENSLYPAFIKIYYESALMPHTMTFQVQASPTGDPITQRPFLIKANGGAADAGVLVAEFVNAIKVAAPATVTFQYWELWEIATDGGDPVFRFTDDLNVVGTSAVPIVPANQIVWSYRTQDGGKGSIYLMATGAGANAKYRGPAFGSATFKTLVDYLVSDACIVKGRDDSRPVVVVKVLTKTNDALRRKLRLT